jgi:DNA polymerase-3 subunit chi
VTRIDFYLLTDTLEEAADRYACQLCEDVYRSGRRVLLRARDAEHCAGLDRLLWSFRDSSFLPHAQFGGDDAPIVLSWGAELGAEHQVLINRGPDIPPLFSRFERVCEILIDEADCRRRGRERYRYYRDQGYPLEHHPLRQRILSHSA